MRRLFVHCYNENSTGDTKPQEDIQIEMHSAHCIIRQNKHTGKSQPQYYTVKKVSNFPLPCGDVTNQTLPGREKLIIPGHGEFGYRHPGWGRENR
jgi:hypothetical protein